MGGREGGGELRARSSDPRGYVTASDDDDDDGWTKSLTHSSYMSAIAKYRGSRKSGKEGNLRLQNLPVKVIQSSIEKERGRERRGATFLSRASSEVGGERADELISSGAAAQRSTKSRWSIRSWHGGK